MGRHLSKDDQKTRVDRIVKLHDAGLTFGMIAKRLGISLSFCSQLYYKEKEGRAK